MTLFKSWLTHWKFLFQRLLHELVSTFNASPVSFTLFLQLPQLEIFIGTDWQSDSLRLFLPCVDKRGLRLFFSSWELLQQSLWGHMFLLFLLGNLLPHVQVTSLSPKFSCHLLSEGHFSSGQAQVALIELVTLFFGR